MNLRAAIAIVLCLANLGTVYADQLAEKPIIAAAQSWLGEIDSGNYGNSWKQASSYFQGAVTEKNWTDALTGARRPLGKLLARKLAKTQSATSLPGAPDGNYLVMQFDTSFENKKSAVELVTFVREKDGNWRAAGYYIK
jgi:opacity protein-like surface antigen